VNLKTKTFQISASQLALSFPNLHSHVPVKLKKGLFPQGERDCYAAKGSFCAVSSGAGKAFHSLLLF